MASNPIDADGSLNASGPGTVIDGSPPAGEDSRVRIEEAVSNGAREGEEERMVGVDSSVRDGSTGLDNAKAEAEVRGLEKVASKVATDRGVEPESTGEEDFFEAEESFGPAESKGVDEGLGLVAGGAEETAESVVGGQETDVAMADAASGRALGADGAGEGKEGKVLDGDSAVGEGDVSARIGESTDGGLTTEAGGLVSPGSKRPTQESLQGDQEAGVEERQALEKEKDPDRNVVGVPPQAIASDVDGIAKEMDVDGERRRLEKDDSSATAETKAVDVGSISQVVQPCSPLQQEEAMIPNSGLCDDMQVQAEGEEGRDMAVSTEPVKKRRGRPPKNRTPNAANAEPKKTPTAANCTKSGKRRGRPPKNRNNGIVQCDAEQRSAAIEVKEDGHKLLESGGGQMSFPGVANDEDAHQLDSLTPVADNLVPAIPVAENSVPAVPVAKDAVPAVPVPAVSNSGKRKQGKPRKLQLPEDYGKPKIRDVHHMYTSPPEPVVSSIEYGKKPKGRPPKNLVFDNGSEVKPVKKRGRPRKNIADESNGSKLGSELNSVYLESGKKRKAAELDSSDMENCDEKRERKGNSEPGSQSPTNPITIQQIDALSTSEILSQLYLIATEPRDAYDFLPAIGGFFFSKLRARHWSRSFENMNISKSGTKRDGKWKAVSSDNESLGTLVAAPVQDSYWSDIALESNPENKQASRGRKRKGGWTREQNKKAKLAVEASLSLSQVPPLDAAHVDQQELDGERVVSNSGEEKFREDTPTALILTFNESEFVPAAEDLVSIFSPYGALREGETEILRKTSRAKVVFRYRDDAEKAFNNAGMDNVFGQAVVSYRLRCLPLPKASPIASPQNNNVALPIANGNVEIQEEGTGIGVDNV